MYKGDFYKNKANDQRLVMANEHQLSDLVWEERIRLGFLFGKFLPQMFSPIVPHFRVRKDLSHWHYGTVAKLLEIPTTHIGVPRFESCLNPALF